MLKRNSKKVLKIIAGQKPDERPIQAYLKVHPNASPLTASSNVSQLMAKPEAQIYLKEQVEEASATIVDVMRNARKQKESATFQRLAKDSAESIQNRELGTPTQTIKQTTTGVQLVIDLTSALSPETARLQ